jgi:hypothetical protein
MLDKIGGRKFLYAVLIVALGYSLVVLNQTTAKEWMAFAAVIGGTYIIGNVASKFANGNGEVQ